MRKLSTFAVVLAIALVGCSTNNGPQPTPSEGVKTPVSTPTEAAKISVSMLLAGSIDDGGFMESGYLGLQRAAKELGVETTYREGVKPEKSQLEEALRELADEKPDMVIAHGGQNAEAATTVAAEYPDVTFVVTQASVTGANLSSYEVLQEESAWLAGAAAGLLTKTNVVGHMSGIRVTPGLKGRAAYVDGVAHTNPQARVLTNFSGDQDDVALARRVALAEIDGGADYIFTMLNAGRPGVAEAIAKTQKAREFGNVKDFTKTDPKTFVGSAIADSGAAAFNAIRDQVDGSFKPGVTKQIGLEEPEAVALTLAPDVPVEVRRKVEDLAKQIVAEEITVRTEYDGPEFQVAS